MVRRVVYQAVHADDPGRDADGEQGHPGQDADAQSGPQPGEAHSVIERFTALTVATDAGYPHALGTSGSDALTLLLVDMQHNGYVIDTLFFGLWLLPLGYLVIRSGYFPKALGVLGWPPGAATSSTCSASSSPQASATAYGSSLPYPRLSTDAEH